MNTRRVTALIALVVIGLVACATHQGEVYQSPHYRDSQFQNMEPFVQDFSLSKTLDIVDKFWFQTFPDTEPTKPIPLQPLTREQLYATQGDHVWRLGHSTVLMKLSGQFWITDPIFSDRASPVQWAGPERFHASPIALDELPPLQGVIISHDHYDHLDEQTISALHARVQHFFVPLGVAKYLKDWGVAEQKIMELDWWESRSVGAFRITSTPANHFSGRGLFNRNQTLWSSWVIDSGKRKIFFSGDSGYFDGFKMIGKEYGPFDLTIMENGAYNTDWAKVHMFPEQTLQAHKDLGGRLMLPVHNGTFKLAFHPWHEPLEKIVQLSLEDNIEVQTPKMGDALSLDSPQTSVAWWRDQPDIPRVAQLPQDNLVEK